MSFARSLAFLGLFFSMQALANPTVHEGQLQNGLRVVVAEDHRAPVVAIQIWVGVGGVDELPGETGLSHALEHMMFKGTPTHPGKKMADEISHKGGEQNAVTSSDFTYYYTVIGRQFLPSVLQLEADRFANLRLDEADFAKEREVIKEERRMRIDDNPRGVLREQFQALAYTESPYRRPVIGWPNDLANMKISALRAWYQTWYVPNNLTLVIAGDTDFASVMKLAEKTFGRLPTKKIPLRSYLKDEAPLAEKTLTLSSRVEMPIVLMGFSVPALQKDEKDPFVLEVIDALLSLDNSARFPKKLQRESQVAVSSFSSYDGISRGDTLFIFGGSPKGEIADLETALLNEIEALKTIPVDETELGRVKTALIAKLTYAQDDINEKAAILGELASLKYPISLLDDYPKYIHAVTAADIQRVASAYFTQTRLTKARSLPKAQPVEKQAEPLPDTQVQS